MNNFSISWKLKRTRQCAKCPWKTTTDPHSIPHGYDPNLHCKLESTIADPEAGADELKSAMTSQQLMIMACHEEHPTHCIGWLHNQLHHNNIPLRIAAINCTNLAQLQLDGSQHSTFDATLPD